MNARLNLMITLAGVMVFSVVTVKAQGTKEQGAAYWVVEGNIKTKDYTVIRYYDVKDELVGEERLEGQFLDITKRRNVKFLNTKLRAWKTDTLAGKEPGRKTGKKIL